MTKEELDRIEKRNDKLYSLYNDCANANARWHSEHAEVRKLMAHLDSEFPGKDVCLLLQEVIRLQTIITKAQLSSPSATAITKTD